MAEPLLPHDRPALRTHLREQRRAWLTKPEAQAATAALNRSLHELLVQLEPLCLGLCWPLEGEFNAADAAQSLQATLDCELALCFARKTPREMHYRRWDGQPPSVTDECGIASCEGAPLVPDVVLVPCVGFTREGYRLGYGGGYFDRWLGQHPGVTSIGLAWSVTEASFAVEPHDVPLSLILTEREVIAP